LIVEIDGHSNATLIGPAVIVKDVELDKYLWAVTKRMMAWN
jgi:diaminopimelate epimerase